MGKFGEVTVGRIGCFKSDTIFLPSISYIALDRKREIDAGGGGITRGHNATFRRVLHARAGFEIRGGPVARGHQKFCRTTGTLGSRGPTGHWNFPDQNCLKDPN